MNVNRARHPTRLWLLAAALAMSSASDLHARDPVLIDFEQFPYVQTCPDSPSYKGASFYGGAVTNNPYYPSQFPGKVYRTQQQYNYCFYHYIEIFFDEPVGAVSFELMSPGHPITVSDNAGWSRDINMAYEFDSLYGSMTRITVMIPSQEVRHLTITDHCDYYFSGTGCDDPWSFLIDDVSFRSSKPCLDIAGPPETTPNPRWGTPHSAPFEVLVTDCDGSPVPDVAVKVVASAEVLSGGHSHTEGRPTGAISDRVPASKTDGSMDFTGRSDDAGRIELEFIPPEVSGTHMITAGCTEISCFEPEMDLSIDVKVADLTQLAPSEHYVLIGDKPEHPSNHWLTVASERKVQDMVSLYSVLQGTGRLCFNDGSLETGGLFDVSYDWQPSHYTHRKGTVIDVRANGRDGCGPIDAVDRDLFRLAALFSDARAVYEEFVSAPDSNHFHVVFDGVSE